MAGLGLIRFPVRNDSRYKTQPSRATSFLRFHKTVHKSFHKTVHKSFHKSHLSTQSTDK